MCIAMWAQADLYSNKFCVTVLEEGGMDLRTTYARMHCSQCRHKTQVENEVIIIRSLF